MLKNKVMYRQFIHSVAFVNQKIHLCLYFPDTPRISLSIQANDGNSVMAVCCLVNCYRLFGGYFWFRV